MFNLSVTEKLVTISLATILILGGYKAYGADGVGEVKKQDKQGESTTTQDGSQGNTNEKPKQTKESEIIYESIQLTTKGDYVGLRNYLKPIIDEIDIKHTFKPSKEVMADVYYYYALGLEKSGNKSEAIRYLMNAYNISGNAWYKEKAKQLKKQ